MLIKLVLTVRGEFWFKCFTLLIHLLDLKLIDFRKDQVQMHPAFVILHQVYQLCDLEISLIQFCFKCRSRWSRGPLPCAQANVIGTSRLFLCSFFVMLALQEQI